MGKEGRWSPLFRERAPMLALVGCLLAASPREAALVPVAVHPAPGYGETVDAKPPKKTTDPDAVDPHAGDWYPHGEVHEFCKGNIIDRGLTTCCSKKCGQCGGSHCANHPAVRRSAATRTSCTEEETITA